MCNLLPHRQIIPKVSTHVLEDPPEALVDAERQLVPLPHRLLLGGLVLTRSRADVLL